MNGKRRVFSFERVRGFAEEWHCSTAAIGAFSDLILCIVACQELFTLSLSILGLVQALRIPLFNRMLATVDEGGDSTETSDR